MNIINNNIINPYSSNYVHSTNVSVQSVKDETSKLNATVKNTTTVGDTVKISADKKAAFFKTLNEVSSESESVQLGSSKVSASAAFINSVNKMNNQAWDSNSSSDYFSNYSDLIDNVKNYISSSNDSSNDSSNNVINFCDTLKERLAQYGIN